VRRKITAAIASFLVGAVVPTAAQPMIGNNPGILLPVIGASLLLAVAILTWGNATRPLLGWRKNMFSIGMMAIGFCVFAGGAFLYWRDNHTTTHESPEAASKASSAPTNSTGTAKSENQSGGVTAGVIHGGVTINNAPATPSRENYHEKMSDTIWLEFGTNRMGTSAANLEKSTALNLGGYVPFKLHVKGGVLYCDVTVLGGADDPHVEIKENEFSVKPPNWDKNFSANAFEVVNETGDPVLQLIRKSAGHYVVNGYFPFSGGLIVATNDGMAIIRRPGVPLPKLQPIFRYPSWKHSGQYVDN
jgi:hypothetical protein